MAMSESAGTRIPAHQHYITDTLRGHGHVCAFFPTPEDEYRILLPFMKERLAIGERTVHVMPRDRRDHADRLRAAGIDVDTATRQGQLELLISETTYLREGRFDEDAMIAMLTGILDKGRALGFPRTCVVAHAEHVFSDTEDARAFLAYEIRLNKVLAGYPDSVICAYDLGEISTGRAAEVLRAHHTVMVNGTLIENPHFVSPEASLEELQELLTRTLPAADPRRRPRGAR
jgi:hypothetical protein